ncbi:S1C family serine protease [Kitasatospora sp. NBC_01287]|uniref:S1C family serine protease n=1 Tax=Kitasatospora sp. NBC_01287 TaxID=2903573 RepID=UPI002258F96B|nr:trypsin-like peptidase domain-containing protein [Kitasatospora sp. NBC_01287]MCX4744147.1 S1C family serine protease [Kitasatospora sp. NBC_01287]
MSENHGADESTRSGGPEQYGHPDSHGSDHGSDRGGDRGGAPGADQAPGSGTSHGTSHGTGPAVPPGGWGPPPLPGTAVPGAPPTPPSGHLPPPPPPYPPGGWGPPQHGYPPVPPRRGRAGRTSLVLLAVVMAGVLAGVGLDHAFWQQRDAASPLRPANPAAPFTQSGAGGSSGSGAGAGVATAVDPTLVNIDVAVGYQGAEAAGTGIVLSSSGEVLTNNHVIDGATSISATDVGNGHTYTATVVGYDRTGDLAVIQLKDASGLAPAKLGDSSKVAVGDTVTAIGNAGGTNRTPTAASGSVTALNQDITASDEGSGTSEQLSGMIQVDADVQPGDSGGSLVDSSGAVIGIDTAGSDGSGSQQQAASQGFAIPIDAALPLAQQMEAGKASTEVHIGPTAFLGVEVATGSGAGSGQGSGSGSGQGSGSGSGVPIAGVVQGSPAAQAGLAQGDEITAVDGRTVLDPDALTDLMSSQTPGSQVSVQWVDAAGAQHSATVTLTTGPAD